MATVITAELVKTLRDKTGAGMMDCKRALNACNGDLEEAVQWLRTKGIMKAAERATRDARVGIVGARAEGGRGMILGLNSETDFVARSDAFQDVALQLLNEAWGAQIESLEALVAHKVGGSLVKDKLLDLASRVGENVVLGGFGALSVSPGLVVSYVHGALNPFFGSVAVLVALESEAPADALRDIGKDLAMHVAAFSPKCVRKEELPEEMLIRERTVFKEKALAEGRPPHIVEKIVEGNIRKFCEQVVLEEQAFVKDPSKSVKNILEEASKTLGTPIKIAGIVRFSAGEVLATSL